MGGGGKFYEKQRNLAKNCMNLKELETILGNHENHFGKIIVWGGSNKLKCLENFPKIGNYPPPTIRDGRVGTNIML